MCVFSGVLLATGCSGGEVDRADGRGLRTASGSRDARGATMVADPPAPAMPTLVAIVDGDAIEFDALRPALIELAGETVLRDALLDHRLDARLRSSGVVLGEADITREETILVDALSTDRARAIELLGEIRARQGLGRDRYAALLRRNAGLRALVAPSVVIDENGVRAIYDVEHGPKRLARVARVGSLGEAERFLADRRAGTAFAELAATRSLDSTASRGGLLQPIARLDPSVPESLRAAIFATAPGSMSQPVLDGGQFLVVEVIEELPASSVAFESARARCAEILRLGRERLLMEALARELSSTKGATIFDRAFDRALDARTTLR